MTFFDVLRNLFFFKKENIELDSDGLAQFTPYMINRWFSFYDKTKAILVNETLNRYTSLFDDKVQSYTFYDNFIPKTKFKKINYVKKNKEKKEKEDTGSLDIIARNNNLSVREIRSYIDLSNKISK